MPDTSASFLFRLQKQPASGEWDVFLSIYHPLIRRWLARHKNLNNDLDDLTQNVLTVVVRKLPAFCRQRTGSFRLWLRAITVNCLRDHWKAKRKFPLSVGDSKFLQLLKQLEDPSSNAARFWDQEHDRHVTKHLLEQIKPNFEPKTWLAFKRVALEDASPAEVAKELGMTPNAVSIAKFRVLNKLRKEGQELLD